MEEVKGMRRVSPSLRAGLGGFAFVHHELRSFARTATGVEDKGEQASEEE